MRRFISGIVLAAVVAPLAAQQQTTPQPTDADWVWYEKFRDVALEALMPLTSASDALVAYRSFHDLDHQVIERHFTIRYAHGGIFDRDKLGATIVVPVGPAVQQQLLQLHMADRGASFESVLARIEVRRLTVTTGTCRAIRDQMERLPKVVIRPTPRDAMYIMPIHRVWHRIVINSADDIDVKVGYEKVPIAEWAVKTIDALLACANKRT